MWPLALDGTAQPFAVVASNPGHLLSSGIIDKAEAMSTSERLVKSDMFSGWGIRTLSSDEKAYDLASYHNGSIWPNDNALIAASISKNHPCKEAAPKPYAVSCVPQLWCVGSVFSMVKSLTGLAHLYTSPLVDDHPQLPQEAENRDS